MKHSRIRQNITAQIRAWHNLFVTILWQYQKQIAPFKLKFTELESQYLLGTSAIYQSL